MTTEVKGVNFVPTQNYLIFDDFDLLSITYLFIRGPHFDIDGSSGVHVSGSIGTISHPVTWDLFDRNLDLRGNLPPSPSVPIQFDIYARSTETP
ncbi:hypothetical protein Clacol_002196 [Clathrus columnatus]|uniref:Uncharacterized protein n=1 Tax=Clathrus columnatus TaxID=1419009 RepID=A0AAV5A5G1_9AGAM|nr:hypothetical protein Clacol_002196 [Clathrus columnatus]